jgi:hypothetical protein
VTDALRRGVVIGAGERSLAGERLEEEHAEREDVTARIGGLAQDLLGRHVRGPGQRGGPVQQLRCGRQALVQGDGEAGQLDLPPPRNEHVPRLQIPVHDAVGVGVLETARDLEGHAAGRGRGEAPGARQDLLQRPAVHVLEHQPHAVPGADEVVQVQDAGVVELCEQARLALERGGERRRREDAGAQRLDQHASPQGALQRLVEVGDRPRPHPRDALIPRELGDGSLLNRGHTRSCLRAMNTQKAAARPFEQRRWRRPDLRCRSDEPAGVPFPWAPRHQTS